MASNTTTKISLSKQWVHTLLELEKEAGIGTECRAGRGGTAGGAGIGTECRAGRGGTAGGAGCLVGGAAECSHRQ